MQCSMKHNLCFIYLIQITAISRVLERALLWQHGQHGQHLLSFTSSAGNWVLIVCICMTKAGYTHICSNN